MHNAPKQVIVMRKDLNMRKGKMIAQGAHASMKVFLDRSHVVGDDSGMDHRVLLTTDPMREWIEGLLIDIYNKAKEAGIPCSMIEDAGLTEFNGVVTKTCIAIGPEYPEVIDPITRHLKLL